MEDWGFMELINNPDEVNETQAEQTSTTEESAAPVDQAEGTEQSQADVTADKGKQETVPAEGMDELSFIDQAAFLSEDERSKLREDLQNDPELKRLLPLIKGKFQQFQSGFTKAMQAVPKEYRDGAKIKDLQTKAQAYERLNSNPELVKLVNGFLQGKKPDGETTEETKQRVTDKIDAFKQGLTAEQKAHIDWLEPYIQELISNAISPLGQDVGSIKDNATRQELLNNPELSYINFTDDRTWNLIREKKQKNPSLSWEEASVLVIGASQLREHFSQEGKSEATKAAEAQNAKKTAGKVPVLGGAKPGEGPSKFSKTELLNMDADTFAREMNLPRVDKP